MPAKNTTNTNNTSAAQEPDFLQQMEALMAATSAQLEALGETRRPSGSGPKPNPVWEALEPLTQAALIRAGMAHTNNLLIEREGNDHTPMKDRPVRMTPVAGKKNDAWATARNRRRHLFILSIIALAGGNKGKIALVDIACLYIAYELPQYDGGNSNDMNSTHRVATTLFTRLHRSIEIDGETLEIKGLRPDPLLAQWVAPANAQIAKVKSLIRSEQ